MKVKELIAELQKFDPELPVAVADWNEEYSAPSESHCYPHLEENRKYYPEKLPPGSLGASVVGTFVCIG